jgi:hypothetical protein
MNEQKEKYMQSIHMASGMLTFNPEKAVKIFRVGDVIQFYPTITIDYYTASIREEAYLQHVIYDIYKFRFRPIAKYPHDIHKNCYHYLIEIFPDFKLFCFNWTNPYKSYLKVGQWYEGHGQLSNCGNASECNENISPLIMDSILTTGKVTGIYENFLWRDFRKNMANKIKRFRYGENAYCYEDVLDGYGYNQDLEKFNANTSGYRENNIFYNSTEEISESWEIIFCIDILNSQKIRK